MWGVTYWDEFIVLKFLWLLKKMFHCVKKWFCISFVACKMKTGLETKKELVRVCTLLASMLEHQGLCLRAKCGLTMSMGRLYLFLIFYLFMAFS